MLELSPPQSKEHEAIIAAFLPRHAWGERSVANLVGALRRNKYPLLALELAGSSHPLLSTSNTWREALAAERRSLAEQRGEFLKVKHAWYDHGIPSVLFKSAGIAPSFPYTSDNVDVLVPASRTMEARRILLAMGYVWLRNIDETQKWLFRKFAAGRSVSAVHVHGWVGWDVEFHERAIWDGVRQSADDPEVMVPSAEDAVLINASHALYENKEIRLYDLEKIRSQWGNGLDWMYMEGIARRRGWLDGLYFALLVCQKLERELFGYRTVPSAVVARWKRGLREYPLQWAYWKKVRSRPLDLPFRVSFVFSKLLYYKKIANDEHDGLRDRAANFVRTLAWGIKQKSGVRPQKSRLVTLSGLDGAGKTAHAEAVSEALETSEVINRIVWTRAGTSPAYKALSGAAQRLLPGTRDEVKKIATNGTNAAPGLAKQVWAWLNALDLALTYQAKVRLPLLTGKAVVCDRYTYDAAVEIAHRLGASDPMSLAPVRLMMALTPKPDAAYFLRLPPELAAYRSLDPEDTDDLALQAMLYGRVADDGRLRLLDVSGPFGEANDRLVREVVQEYEDNFATRTNGLLLSNPDQLNPQETGTRNKEQGTETRGQG